MAEKDKRLKNIIEALLVVSEAGLTHADIKSAVGEMDITEIEEALSELKRDYDETGRSFTVAEIAGRFRIVTRPEYVLWIKNLFQPEPERLSRPALETLAIIAYKQPLTRTEIEGIRGVNVDGVVKTLFEKDLIIVKGRKDVPGRPILYGTGEKFLELFGLSSLDDLPKLKEFSEEDLAFGKPDENLIVDAENVPVEAESVQAAGQSADVDKEGIGEDEAEKIN